MQPLPHRGETFTDSRNGGRTLRVSGHPEAGTVVLSVWDHGQCRASFRLPAGEVGEFVRALLTAAPPELPLPAAPSAGLTAPPGAAAAPSDARPLLTVPPMPEPAEPPDAGDDADEPPHTDCQAPTASG